MIFASCEIYECNLVISGVASLQPERSHAQGEAVHSKLQTGATGQTFSSSGKRVEASNQRIWAEKYGTRAFGEAEWHFNQGRNLERKGGKNHWERRMFEEDSFPYWGIGS